MKRKSCFLLFLALSVCCAAIALAQKPRPTSARIASAYTNVYSRYARDCKDVDLNTVSEGEDVPQLCKGFGGYSLYRTSAVYRVSLAVQDASRKFTIPVAAAENEEAKALEPGCVKKFGDKIEWRMANGKPFAFILRVSYYRDTNDEQTVFKPQNKVGEFLFVRGLKGFESLRYEVGVTDTAFNPNEQARRLADSFYEKTGS